MRRFRRSPTIAALLFAALASLPRGQEPARTGKVEEAEVHVVLIDVVVTDRDDRPLRGLARGDFSLRVDGNDAAISSFEDHCAAAPAQAAESGAAASGSSGSPSAPAESGGSSPARDAPAVSGGTPAAPSAPAAPAEPARTVLYFDLPHLSPHGAARSIRHARRFLESNPEDRARFMVIAYGPDIRVLTSFTDDRARILEALEKVTERGATYDEGPVARSNKIQEVAHETCPPEALDKVRRTCDPQVAVAREMARQEEVLARRSLEALRATLLSLGGLPGRKALVFFTETLKQEPGVHYLEIARTTPRGELISVDQEFRAAVEEANASSVSFYPVYAAGLDDSSDTEVGRSQTSLGTKGQREKSMSERQTEQVRGQPGPGSGASQMTVDIGPIAQAQRSAEAASLGFNASIAAETGGRHLGRTNDLSLIFPIVREEMSCFYVLGYQPRGASDGKRHGIAVSVARKGAEVRSRPFYTDWTPEVRDTRRLRTALAAPGAFRDLDVRLEAFALGRAKAGRQVLVKASVPVAALARSAAGLPPDDGSALVALRGRITTEKAEACVFGSDFEVKDAASAGDRGAMLHYEAACALPPGPYDVSAAVLEKRGGTIGAARQPIGVPALSGFHVGEAQLWVSSAADLVHRSQAEAILGPSQGIESGAASPRAERRMLPHEQGSLFFLVCPPERASSRQSAAAADAPGPVTVTRVLMAGEDPVATFPPLRLSDRPDPASGCWGISSAIPQGILGEGVYHFDYEVQTGGESEPIRRRADFAVGAADAPP